MGGFWNDIESVVEGPFSALISPAVSVGEDVGSGLQSAYTDVSNSAPGQIAAQIWQGTTTAQGGLSTLFDNAIEGDLSPLQVQGLKSQCAAQISQAAAGNATLAAAQIAQCNKDIDWTLQQAGASPNQHSFPWEDVAAIALVVVALMTFLD